MTATAKSRAVLRACATSAQVFFKDIGTGVVTLTHSSLALIGLCVVSAALFAATRQDIRDDVEQLALGWLKARQEAREPAPIVEPLIVAPEPQAVARATAADLDALTPQQAKVARWIARRYKVATEPISRLVQEAWQVGTAARLDPTLILAIMAIESSYNPFAQSTVGAQGLMQVMTDVHDDKYQAFGGIKAAFDPVSNLRVGVLVLRECIARAGSVRDGLRYYVGAANLPDDGGYAEKVLAEQAHLLSVAQGKRVAFNAPVRSARPARAPMPPVPAAPVAPAPPEADKDKQVALLN